MKKQTSLWKTTKPIGLAVLAIAIISSLTGTSNYLLYLTTIILIVTPNRFGARVVEYLQQTVEKVQLWIETTLYDGLFWSVVFVAGYALAAFFRRASAEAGQVTGLSSGTPLALPPEALQKFTYSLIGGGLAYLALIILAYAASRAIIWARLSGTKFNRELFKQFLFLSLAWWVLWTPLLLAAGTVAVKNPGASWLILVVVCGVGYFSPFLHLKLIETRKIRTAIGYGIGTAIAQIPKSLVMYATALVVYLIAYQPLRLAQQAVSPTIFQPITLLFVLLFIGWLRVFLLPFIKEALREA